uniref:HAT C-terminal dimerisation domain-containing protein n=1 Tax=Terrapene triunguis TaxID=2587831 RepID=A0A674J5Q6_9SAUR
MSKTKISLWFGLGLFCYYFVELPGTKLSRHPTGLVLLATSAILESYSKIVDALESIAEDQSQKGETIREAENIANKMQELEFVFMLTMWNEILQHFYHTSQALQEKELDLKTCANLCQSLADHLHTLRNDFERFEDISKDILPDTNYKEAQSRKRIRKKQANDKTNFTGEVKCTKKYQPVDLNMNLCGEVRQFHCYMRTKFNETGKMKFSHIDLHDTILKDGIQCVFPNVEIALRIFLTLMITNCSAERSFSQLKRIKNPQRTTMCQDRLDSLSLLCMEADMLRRVSFDKRIQNFAIRKSRKKLF